MRAVVVHDLDTGARLGDVEVDEPRPGEVLVRVVASGVCGSDLHVLHGRSNAAIFPMVMGHEGAGIVEAVGPGVSDLAPGDHVVIALYGPCLACASCRRGQPGQCSSPARMEAIFGRMADGSTRLRQGDTEVHPYVGCGSLAEYAVVRATQAVKVDADIPLGVVCLAGCGVTTGLGAVFNIADVRPGETVAVVGSGGVGLNVIQGARLAGAAAIVAVDTNPAKLALATQFGATDVVNGSDEDMQAAVTKLVPGGVDVAFEVVGSPELAARTFALTHGSGRCVIVGSQPPGSHTSIPYSMLLSNRKLFGCAGGNNIPERDIPRIVDLYRSGRLLLDELVTERVPLEQFHVAFESLEAGKVARAVVDIAPAGS